MDVLDFWGINEDVSRLMCELEELDSPPKVPKIKSEVLNTKIKSLRLSQGVSNAKATSGECVSCELNGGLGKFFPRRVIENFRPQALPVKKCDLCGYSTHLKEVLLAHIKDHFGIVELRCPMCVFGTNNKRTLERHMRSDHSVAESRCPLCDYVTYNYDDLKKHIKTHLENMKPSCETTTDCTIQVNNDVGTKKLKYNKTGRSIQELGCYICQYVSSSPIQLIRHVENLHSTYKELRCRKCSYATRNDRYYKHHTMSHLGANIQHCYLCDFVTSRDVALIDHLHSHNRNGDFRCTTCDYYALNRNNLKEHMETHGEIYRCKQCNYTVRDSNAFSEHVEFHSQLQHVKAYPSPEDFWCCACDYFTSTKAELEKHMQIHSHNKVMWCNDCNYATYCRQLLKNHVKNHSIIL